MMTKGVTRFLFLSFLSLSAWATASAGQLPVPTFKAETIGIIAKGYGLSIADVDGDGKPDILMADVWDFVWYRNGDWKRFVLASKLDGQGAMSIDARDVDGDGKVEIGVCTRGPEAAVYFLQRPQDPTQPWAVVRIPSEPEQHRIQWARDPEGHERLISVPIVGRRSHLRIKGLAKDDAPKVYAYPFTANPGADYQGRLLLDSVHDMHSFAVLPGKAGGAERLLFVGQEGVELMNPSWKPVGARLLPGMTPPNQRPDGSWHAGLGEISAGRVAGGRAFLATIEPKHGTQLVVYPGDDAGAFGGGRRQILDSTLVAAHAMRCVDLLGLGYDQILVGWWGSGEATKDYGIRLFIPLDAKAEQWQKVSIDEGAMSCQSLQVADMNHDGRLDLIAAGWTSKNLVIFWNQTEPVKQ
jgi:VCBS repeat protein